MNRSRVQKRARERRRVIAVEVLGWMAVSIGVALTGLVWYTFAVIVMSAG